MDSSARKDTITINGQEIGKDEKILIERGGKFELVSASKLKAMMPQESKGSKTSKKKSKKDETPKKSKSHSKEPKTKSASVRSAPPKSKSSRNKEGTIDYESIKSPYAMSPEMKALMRKQQAAKEAKQREEEEEMRQAEEEARESAEIAWKAWLEKKRDEKKNEKTDSKHTKDDDLALQKREAIMAYKSWLHTKHKQIRKERLHNQQSQIEQDEGYYMRDRKDCNRAFSLWVKSKSKAILRDKEAAERARKQTITEARRAKRTQDLLKSIQESQQMKYVEYYGYRF